MEAPSASRVDAGAVRLAGLGDERAFRQVVDLYHADLLRVCYSVCRDADVAEEAAQRAWIQAWRKLGGLREPDRLRPWLLAIAANEARKMAKARRRHVVNEITLGDDPELIDFREDAGDVDLRNALARLSADDRVLLALRYVGGLNATELGHLSGLSPSGTRARLGRLLSRLRSELGDG